MITFLTGATGSGKTLRAIWQGVKLRKEGRRVFVLSSREPPVDGVADQPDAEGWYPGIRGLDFVRTGFEPLNVDLSEWRTIGKGSVLIVDEAQRWLHRDRVPSKMPEWLEALTRNRQYGVDLIFITQDPRFLHSMARRLCNYHEHVVRRFGMNVATVLRWESLCEDVSRVSWKKRATVEMWRYPKEVFNYYISSEQHTVKRRVPARLYAMLASVCVAVGLAFFGWHILTRNRHATPAPATAPVAHADLVGSMFGGSRKHEGSVEDEHVSTEVYLQRQVPRVESQPWSAQLFDGRKVLAEPDILCVKSESKGCRCYTEQVTRLNVPLLTCMAIAINGIYNPYRRPLRDSSQSRVAESRSPSVRPAASGVSSLPLPSGPVAAGLMDR